MAIYPLSQNNFSAAIELLKKNNLPTEDIRDSSSMFVLLDGNEHAGVIGIEIYGKDALLRSLCVSEERRNAGAGKTLVLFLEDMATKKFVENLYLLTTTATKFFEHLGYNIIHRDEVPEAIRKTKEFSYLCPSSATVLKKKLR